MHRSGNPRFDCAVSTGGARGPRVDHPSSEGVVLISPLAETNRKAASHRYALAVAVFLLIAAAVPQVSRAQNSAGPTATLTPVALPTDAGGAPPPVAAPAVPPVPQTEIQARLERSGLAVAGEHLHVALLRRFYAAHNYEPVWDSHQAQATALTQVITRAGEHGLDPELFHATALRNAASLPATDRDLLLSDAFLAYADALARGVLPVELRMDDEDPMPAERVWVNTANAQLTLYRGNRPVFTTRVVVGETDKQTPEVQATIGSVLFNPPWNVPRSIAAKEIYPKLSANPDYLAQHHMIIRKGGLIQQLPGEKSALGQVKFEMPNRFDVYLHDTPLKNLFSSDSRRRSHGCVRVQNPRELASLLLQRSMETIEQRIALGHTNSLSLPAPVPVFFVYQT